MSLRLSNRLILRRVEKAIDHLRQGRMIVLLDNIKEQEADLMIAAQYADKDRLAHFLNIVGAGGLFCVPMKSDAMDRLGLSPMTLYPTRSDSCNLMEGVDSKKGTTGISAEDKARVIDHLVKSDTTLLDRPGHTFPLRERPGGFSERQGHTESSLKLIELPGLPIYAAVIEEIMEGGYPRIGADLEMFVRMHDLAMVTIPDIKAYIQCRA